MTVHDNRYDRTLLWSLGASLIVHAIVFGTPARWGGIPPAIPRSAVGITSPLQVALEAQGIKLVPVPVMVEQADFTSAPTPEQTALNVDPTREVRARTGQPMGSPAASDATSNSDAADPLGSIAIGPIKDPYAVGPLAAAELALRYPAHAQRPPRLQGTVVATYPLNALRARIERRVNVLLAVDATGAITSARVIPDDPDFGPAVLASLQGVRFKPADVDGQPVPYWTILQYLFTVPDVSRSGQR